MTDEKTRQLENRIDKLESTMEKMMPSRRDALKMGGAALVGGAAMSGTASAGTNQVGTIGSASQPVDLESEDINNADTVTTENLVVNNTATGPFGGGGAPVLEAGDTIISKGMKSDDADQEFVQLYSGTASDVLGGVVTGRTAIDFLYEFSDGTTFTLQGGIGATTYTFNNDNFSIGSDSDSFSVDFLPPALDIVRIEVAHFTSGTASLGGRVLLKD